MGPDLDDVLRALRTNADKAKELRIELGDDYLGMIEHVESLPENQAGANKTDRDPLCRTYKQAFRHAKAAPPVP
jgi:hypothetical protein